MKIVPFFVAVGIAAFAPSLVPPRPTATASADDPPPKKDDKPGKKEKHGTPTGEVRGGKGGTEFRDKARGRLTKVTIRAGSWVDAVQCTWDDEGDADAGTLHGGSGGEETVITLEPGETLTEVAGSLLTVDDLTVIGSIGFKTTKRTIEPVGESTDGPKFSLAAPKGQEICGFQGRSSDYLDAVGLVCRPLP